MRTENASALTPDRLRGFVGRARRWMGSWGASTRWAAGGVALTALLAAGYFLATEEPVGWAWIQNGSAFTPEEVSKISKILGSKGIQTVSKDRRISVPSGRLLEAESTLLKLNALPPSLQGILDESPKPAFFETPLEREQRVNRNRARTIEAAIRSRDDALSAIVIRTPIRARGRSFDQAETVRIVAILRSDDGRLISSETIEAIQHLILSMEPDLKPDALVLLDHKLRPLLDSANPALVTRARARMREEEMTSDIKSQLNWIEGVRVSVNINPSTTHGARTPVPAPAAVPNAPMNLEPDPASAAPAQVALPIGAVPIEKPRILIQVPIAHYRNQFRISGANQQPSPDDLAPYVTRTEDLIQRAVAQVVPEAELSELQPERAMRLGKPADSIVAYASEHGIDLIVMGTHGREGLAHMLAGSVAETVVRRASCPVLTLHYSQLESIVPKEAQAEVRATA